MKGSGVSKRMIALVASLITVAARRLDLSAEDLAILLDLVELVLGAGIGAHALSALRAARRLRSGGAALLVLLAGGCPATELRACRLQVSRSDSSLDRLVCEDHAPIKVPRLEAGLRQCVLDRGSK